MPAIHTYTVTQTRQIEVRTARGESDALTKSDLGWNAHPDVRRREGIGEPHVTETKIVLEQ